MLRREIALAICLLLTMVMVARAGDYLNEQEAERVREAQEIDKRTAVFLHIAERRLNVLTGTAPVAAAAKDKKEKKEKKEQAPETGGDYGAEPQGSTVELLVSYAKVMSELLDKLDDNYERKKKDPSLTKALDKLLTTGQQHVERLNQLHKKIKSREEETALEKAIEIAKMAIDGARSFKTQQ
jgi:hypothetical protein